MEIALLLAALFGGVIGFFIGRATAPSEPEGTVRPGPRPGNPGDLQ